LNLNLKYALRKERIVFKNLGKTQFNKTNAADCIVSDTQICIMFVQADIGAGVLSYNVPVENVLKVKQICLG